jgi:hypothetical protein
MLHKPHLEVEQNVSFLAELSCQNIGSVRDELNRLKSEVHQSDTYKFSIYLAGKTHSASVRLLLFVMRIHETCSSYAV